MINKVKTVIDLKDGERAIIDGFNDYEIEVKLLELGCFPGSQITFLRAAPFHGPYYLKINGINFALRRTEADKILIKAKELSQNGDGKRN